MTTEEQIDAHYGSPKLLIIGDVHGKVDAYWKLLQKHKPERSIQLGDFGFKAQHDWHLQHINSNRHKIVFGNHDYYPYVGHRRSSGSWSHDDEHRLMTIRGAFSIDRQYRTQGVGWFPEEEMGWDVWNSTIESYAQNKPAIVVSHDCPQSIKESMFGFDNHTVTGNGLQACLDTHKPQLWIFGHYHQSRSEVINGTRFVCLNELETFKI